jgi:hypothetical protein
VPLMVQILKASIAVATAVENYIRYDKAKNKHPATH